MFIIPSREAFIRKCDIKGHLLEIAWHASFIIVVDQVIGIKTKENIKLESKKLTLKKARGLPIPLYRLIFPKYRLLLLVKNRSNAHMTTRYDVAMTSLLPNLRLPNTILRILILNTEF